MRLHLMPHVCLLMFVIPAMLFGQWDRRDIPATSGLIVSIDFARPNAGAVVGLGPGNGVMAVGRALFTRDSGATWLVSQIPDSARALVQVEFVSGDTGYIVGAYNVPTPAGLRERSPLTPERSPSERKVFGLSLYLARIGFNQVDDYRGLFLETTDGGMTWSTKGQLPDSIYYLVGSSFIDSHIGFATGQTTHDVGTPCVLRTTNGGSTWTKLTVPDSLVELRGISFSSESTGVAVGYMSNLGGVVGAIIRTSDGGATWQLQEYPSVNNFTAVTLTDSARYFAVGVSNLPRLGDGVVFVSTDGGSNWSPLPYAPESTIVTGVHFIKGTGSGIVYGVRWGSLVSPLIARTTDDGETWSQTVVALDSGGLAYGGTLVTPDLGFVGGQEGLQDGHWMLLRTTSGGLTDVRHDGDRVPPGYALSQNYPNPFNPSTTISFALASHTFVSLTVNDLLGRVVARLISGELQAGTHSSTWNAAGFSSGIYFYRLQAGTRVETKKLVLLR